MKFEFPAWNEVPSEKYPGETLVIVVCSRVSDGLTVYASAIKSRFTQQEMMDKLERVYG